MNTARKLKSPVLLSTLLLFVLIPLDIVCAESSVSVWLDGNSLDLDVPAWIIDGRTMVPMRPLFEKFGAETFPVKLV